MGTWGSGLYSNDMAADLRPLVNTALKLPLTIDEIVDLIVNQERQVALDPNDEDYTTFWLVLADLIWKSGDRSTRVFGQAIAIIDDGRDLRMCEILGMGDSDLKKRAKALHRLKIRLAKVNEGNKRKALSKPIVQLFSVGDLLRFPVDERDQAANPYFPVKHLESTFVPVSEKSCVIVEVGMAFEFFPWYRPIVQLFENGRPIDQWVVMNPGTVSKAHMKKMRIRIDENLDLSAAWLASIARIWTPGVNFAVSNISMSNSLSIAGKRSGKAYRRAEWEKQT